MTTSPRFDPRIRLSHEPRSSPASSSSRGANFSCSSGRMCLENAIAPPPPIAACVDVQRALIVSAALSDLLTHLQYLCIALHLRSTGRDYRGGGAGTGPR